MAEAVLGETVHSMLAAWPSCRCARLLEWLVFTPIVLIWRALLASHALDGQQFGLSDHVCCFDEVLHLLAYSPVRS